MRPLIATFATTDPHYQAHAERLGRQAADLNLSCFIERLAPWTDNKRAACCYRPRWILNQIDRLGPLLWFDVDGDILAPIEIPDGFDVGLAENPPFWRRKCPENTVTAGLMFFNDTDGSRGFLERWAELCEQWKPGEPGSHRRLCRTREEVEYREFDLTPHVTGRVVLRGAKGEREIAL